VRSDPPNLTCLILIDGTAVQPPILLIVPSKKRTRIMENQPVVPHKAVAEVSKIGNYRRGLLL
jgi:hypothetical protein